MLCQNCQQREAVVFLTKMINGQTTQIHLCQECAQKVQGFNISLYPIMVSDFLQALFGMNLSGQTDQTLEGLHQEKCPGCGSTFPQIQQVGRMGCSKCYDTFESQMEMLLRRIHGGAVHVGKVPVRGGVTYKNKQELVKLRSELQELIQDEKFEEAAVLRDRIRKLEKTVGGESQ